MKKTRLTILVCLCLSIVFGQMKAQDSLQKPKVIAFADNCGYLSLGLGFPNLYQKILVNKIDKVNKELHAIDNIVQNAYSYSVSSTLNREIRIEAALSKNIGLQFTGNYFQVNASETHTYYIPSSTNTNTIKYADTTTVQYKSISLGVRFNFHYCISTAVDVYSGFGTGINIDDFYLRFGSSNPLIKSSALNTQKLTPFPVNFSATTGVRLYLSRVMALYFEAGFDKWTVLQTGIVFKLK